MNAVANTRQAILITGATGFVGSHFIYHVLRHHPHMRVFALVRSSDAKRANQRLCDQLATVASAYYHAEALDLSRLAVMVGDIEHPLCGLNRHDLETLSTAGSLTLFHVAASLAFDETRRSEILRVNVGGTANVLRLARAVDTSRFVYVSTAYSCGRTRGEVAERPVPFDTSFNNAYEFSKARAERLCRRACHRWGMECQVVRPSIVVGVSSSYRPGGAESGLYGFVLELLRLRRLLQRNTKHIDVLGEPNCEINLIPVDALAAQLWSLHQAGYPGGDVHHLTSSFGPRVEQILDVIAEECELPSLSAVVSREDTPTPLERLFDRRMDFYSSYLSNPKHFVRRDGVAGGLSIDEVRLLVRQAVAARGTKVGRVTFKRDQHRSFDGFPINTYEGGNPLGEPLLFANALGVSVDILEPLLQRLAPRFRIISWESRGVPSASGELTEHAARFEAHEADLLAVADKYGLTRFHLAGYCTGGELAFQVAGKYPQRVLSVAALNGAFHGETELRTPFQDTLWKLVPYLAASRKLAALHQALVFGRSSASPETRDWDVMLGSLDPALLHLTSLPFQSGENLHRYALLLQGFANRSKRHRRPRCPALVMTSSDDPITHPQASIATAQATGASLEVFENLNHFGLYTSPEYQDRLQTFILSCAQAHTARRFALPPDHQATG